jgi:hypothetical protein
MIPRDRIEHIASTFGLDTFGLSDIAIFDRIANQAGINVNLDRSQKLTVLRRLGGKKKWAKYSFVDLVIMVMTRDQRKLLSQRSDQASRRAKAAQRAMVRDTLHQPVTRLASQPEHLTVLAGLPASHFYASVEWKATRADVLRLSAYRCEWCGATTKDARLEVDHIVTRLIAPERAFDLNNLRVLCKPCHDGRHTVDRGVMP